MIVAPGWYKDIPMADYLAIDAMSSSGIELFRRSPLHFKVRPEDKETPAKKEGTALHLALLEPEKFKGRYISVGRCEATKSDRTRCTYNGSVIRLEAGKAHSYCGTHDPFKGRVEEGIEIMPAEALDRIEGMRQAVLAHPDARQFFVGRGASELVGVWKDPATGVLCKIRLDRQIDRADFIHADLKSTADASEDAFRRTAGRLGYHRKCSWYRRGMAELGKPATSSVLIAVESPKPHGCATYILDEVQLKKVGQAIDGLLYRYAECLETGNFPGYDTGLRHLSFAKWDMPAEQRGEGAEWDASAEWEQAEGEEAGF